MTIKTWAEADRPREKLIDQGRRALTDAELMAILIGSGSRNESAVDLCRRLLNDVSQDLNVLSRMTVPELCRYRGMGPAKAVTIVAALELGRRRRQQKEAVRPLLDSKKRVYNYIAPLLSDLPHEEFWVLYLNRQCRLICKRQMSKGGRDFAPVDIGLLFRAALEVRADSLTLVHNHPSGISDPSVPDIVVTKRICDAAALFNLKVNDHLIIGHGHCQSLLECAMAE